MLGPSQGGSLDDTIVELSTDVYCVGAGAICPTVTPLPSGFLLLLPTLMTPPPPPCPFARVRELQLLPTFSGRPQQSRR